MADWSKPTLADTFANWLAFLKNRDTDTALQLDPAYTSPTNVPAHAIRWNSANGYWETYSGTAWGALASQYAIDVASLGGHAAASYALLADPAFTGSPTAPTQSGADNSTKLATTQWVTTRIGGITITATSGTFTLTNLKTLAVTASLTLAGTDGKTLTITNSLALAGTDGSVITFQATGTYISRLSTDQGANRVKNKDLDSTTTAVVDTNDTTKKLVFDLSAGTAAKTMTLKSSPSVDRITTLQDVSGTVALTDVKSQVFSGGATITSNSLVTGSITVDCGKGPLQYITNGGAFTINPPAADGSCIILITNNASAGVITMGAFTVGTNTGDAFDTTNTHKFMLSIVRINGVSTYSIKALQ